MATGCHYIRLNNVNRTFSFTKMSEKRNCVKILQNITLKTAKVPRIKFKVVTKTSCPICRRLLTLRQINRTTAIYLCDDLKCPYPLEETCPYPCIMVQRPWKDINKPAPDDREWTEQDWRDAAERERLGDVKNQGDESGGAQSMELFDIIDSYVERESHLASTGESQSMDDFFEEMFK